MNDTPSSNDAGSMEARVTKAGRSNRRAGAEGHGSHCRNSRACAEKIVQNATTAAAAAANRAKTTLGDASDAAQQAEDVVDAGRRATESVSQQIQKTPLMAVLVGAVLGYVAAWWFHGGRR
jgi:ElaB/YqjD/DUF883 family membrane-anchored ribosome-binding protein